LSDAIEYNPTINSGVDDRRAKDIIVPLTVTKVSMSLGILSLQSVATPFLYSVTDTLVTQMSVLEQPFYAPISLRLVRLQATRRIFQHHLHFCNYKWLFLFTGNSNL